MRSLLFIILTGLALTQTVNSEERPNVVVILADDQGWGDLSFNGNTNLSTPQIDSIARSGAVLERFFVCPVCAPTRAEFLTGRYHPRGGVRGVSTGEERLNLDERTVAEAFQKAGYATGLFGKWHNGSQWPYHPNARGFDEFYGFTSGHWGEYFDAPLEHNGESVQGKGFIADDLTDHALAFISTNRARPFFCYLPFNTPHSPFSVPEADWDKFKSAPIGMRGQDGDREDLPVTRAVLALTENLDRNVGRVLARLEELNLREKTIVIYFSDNGPNSWRWNGGMKGRKASTDEGGVRAPFFIRWPGKIRPGTTHLEIAGAIDLLPTLTALAGIPRVGSKPLDGLNLAPLLLQQSNSMPERLIFSFQNGAISVRSDQYRLDAGKNLYDLSTDPGQKTNLATIRPKVAEQLTRAAAAWHQEMFGTNLVQRNKGWKQPVKVGLPADARPFPVGYAEFPRTPLPARDGVGHGDILRSASAPNCSYFTHWASVEDSITWDIEVHTAGEYEAVAYYTCAPTDEGSKIELSWQTNRLNSVVAPGWNPPLQKDHDRVPRKGESYLKDFHRLKLGTITLQKGRAPLTLRAKQIPGQNVMDLWQLDLILKK